MSRLTRDGTAKPVSRDQILRREREQGNINFPCSADHVQDWQPFPVDHILAVVCVIIYIYIHIRVDGTTVLLYIVINLFYYVLMFLVCFCVVSLHGSTAVCLSFFSTLYC